MIKDYCVGHVFHSKGDFVRAVGIQATEVFVGGSVGQGTAVPQQYDVDIVLYSKRLAEVALACILSYKK